MVANDLDIHRQAVYDGLVVNRDMLHGRTVSDGRARRRYVHLCRVRQHRNRTGAADRTLGKLNRVMCSILFLCVRIVSHYIRHVKYLFTYFNFLLPIIKNSGVSIGNRRIGNSSDCMDRQWGLPSFVLLLNT